MTRAQRLAPDLAERMAEEEMFWDGDPVSDRAVAQFHALLACVAAADSRNAGRYMRAREALARAIQPKAHLPRRTTR